MSADGYQGGRFGYFFSDCADIGGGLRFAFEGLEGIVSVHLEAGELSAWAAGIIGQRSNAIRRSLK